MTNTQKPVNARHLYTYCPHCKNNLSYKIIDNEQVKACLKCNFIFWNNPKPVVSILTYKNKKVLMLQRSREPLKDYWVLPGGFIRYDETAGEAIKREVKEETGLEIVIAGIVGIYRIDNDPRGIHVDIIFHGKTSGNLKLGNEDKKWRYFSPKNLPNNIAYKHREAINDWYKKGGQYAPRISPKGAQNL